MIFALSDAIWVAIVNSVIGGLLGLAMKWLDWRSQTRAKITADKVDAVVVKVEEVRKTTDGIIPRLVEAGKIEATQEERDRVASITKVEEEKEAEIVRRVEETKSEGAVVMTNGRIPTSDKVASNVEVIKTGVKAVQKDVTAIKTEVTREVKEGVKQGISDAKDDAREKT